MTNELANMEIYKNPYTFSKDGAFVVGAHQTGFYNGVECVKSILLEYLENCKSINEEEKSGLINLFG